MRGYLDGWIRIWLSLKREDLNGKGSDTGFSVSYVKWCPSVWMYVDVATIGEVTEDEWSCYLHVTIFRIHPRGKVKSYTRT